MARSVSELIRAGEKLLRGTGDTSFLDSELIFMHVSGMTRVQTISRSDEAVGEDTAARFFRLIERRARQEPVAYLTGEKEFWGLTFKVSPAVLIPRPETELIVQEAITFIEANPRKALTVVDIGTGSGCIAISIASELRTRKRHARIVATDISADALAVAEDNARRLELSGLIEFRPGDLFSPLADLKGTIDLVVSNPPYIEPGDPKLSPGTAFEPAAALFAPEGGIGVVSDLIRDASAYCADPCAVICEFGEGQGPAIAARALELGGWNCTYLADLSGKDRVIILKKRVSRAD